MKGNALFDNATISNDAMKELKKYGLDKKYIQALKNGYAKSRFGSNGIVKLNNDEIINKSGKTYIYKLKSAKAGDHLRVNGYVNEEGQLIFDYVTKG